MAPQNTSGGSTPNAKPLEYNGQHDSFLPQHLLVIPDYPEVKVLLSSQHCQAGLSNPCTMHFLLGGWQVEGSSLHVSHIFDLGIITMLNCRADKRAKFFPPLWQLVIPLQISMDLLIRVVGIDINHFP